jgi:ubiquitin-like protein ATG12
MLMASSAPPSSASLLASGSSEEGALHQAAAASDGAGMSANNLTTPSSAAFGALTPTGTAAPAALHPPAAAVHPLTATASSLRGVPAGLKVLVHFRATGAAPIMKKTKFTMSASHRFSSVTEWLRKALHLKPADALFVFCSAAFAPNPDAIMYDLFQCYKVQGELVINYAIQVRERHWQDCALVLFACSRALLGNKSDVAALQIPEKLTHFRFVCCAFLYRSCTGCMGMMQGALAAAHLPPLCSLLLVLLSNPIVFSFRIQLASGLLFLCHSRSIRDMSVPPFSRLLLHPCIIIVLLAFAQLFLNFRHSRWVCRLGALRSR